LNLKTLSNKIKAHLAKGNTSSWFATSQLLFESFIWYTFIQNVKRITTHFIGGKLSTFWNICKIFKKINKSGKSPKIITTTYNMEGRLRFSIFIFW
jgi:hypothetical protein